MKTDKKLGLINGLKNGRWRNRSLVSKPLISSHNEPSQIAMHLGAPFEP